MMLLRLTYRLVLLTVLCMGSLLLAAQVIRPYGLVYSDNLKGGCTIFGNTLTHIIDNGTVNLTKMNETGNAANGVGGIGHSQYGNDFSNIQLVDVDGTLPAVSTLFPFGSAWKYWDANSRPTSWETSAFDDTQWATGLGELGFGDGDETTLINGGPFNNRFISIYFRKTITIPNINVFSSLALHVRYDDGAVVYVNGAEVARVNMPTVPIAHSTVASTALDNITDTIVLPFSAFVNGNNTIAVEVHQRSNKSDDLSFDASLLGTNLPTANTVSSSSADLQLPSGNNTIKFARLYWGGRINNDVLAAVPDTLRRIKIRKGTTGGYTYIQAAPANTDVYPIPGTASTNYQSFIDVTNFINTHGAGTYTVADVAASTGVIDAGGNFAGWCIVVAFENTALQYSSIRIYDGYLNVFNGGLPNTQSAVLTGLNVDTDVNGLVNAVMTAMVWEGDANLRETATNPAGDYLKINNNTFSNAVNPVTNMWNGTISRAGVFVTNRNPVYTNQMGIDIDEIQVGTGYGIALGDTSLRVEFGTEADRYFPSVFSLCIGMRLPTISLDKVVADANNNTIVESGELLTYTISGSNSGLATAFNCTVTDTLPINVSYVPNTLEIISCPGITSGFYTDLPDADIAFKSTANGKTFLRFFLGTGANGAAGGQLAPGDSYALRFKVLAASVAGTIINTARINAVSQAGVPLVDDGTAIIGPLGGAIPVKLGAFTALLLNNGNSWLQWTTETELNNSHFEIERSEDGIRFSNRGQVLGHGNSQLAHQYQFTDTWDAPVSLFYYRLKMVDMDGKAAYSKIVALRKGRAMEAAFVAYPNPFADHIKIALHAEKETVAFITLTAADGKTVYAKRIQVPKGSNIIALTDLSPLAKGSYGLKLLMDEAETVIALVK